MKVESVLIENFKSIEELETRPNGKHIFLLGKNGVGKSTVHQAIWLALTGKEIPAEAITLGKHQGLIDIEIGDDKEHYAVELNFSRTGTARKLEVKPIIDGKRGKKISSPRDFLDGLVGKIMFDPFEFLSWKQDKQVKFVKELCGINWDALQKQYDEIYELRENIGREIKASEGFIKESDIQEHEYRIFIEKKDIEALKKQIATIGDDNKKHFELKNKLTECTGNIQRGEKAISDAKLKVEFINSLVTPLNAMYTEALKQRDHVKSFLSQQPMPDDVDNMLNAVEKFISEVDGLIKKKETAQKELGTFDTAMGKLQGEKQEIETALQQHTEKDAAALNQQLEDLIMFNAKVDKVQELTGRLTILTDKKTQQAQYTEQLTDIKQQKLQMIQEANMPVPGLSIDIENEYLTLDGLPFDETQISKSKIIAAGIDILMATNPRVRICRIKDGALLDKDTLKMVLDYVNEYDFQAFVEIVDREGGELKVEIIEN